MGEPYTVGKSAVSMMSLTPTGSPASGDCGSTRRACSSAYSGSIASQAWTASSRASMRSRQSRTRFSAAFTNADYKKKRARWPKGPPGALSPSEVPVSPAAAPVESPRPALPLMKVRCSSEYCYASESRVHRASPLPPRSRPFNRILRYLFVRRPPQACAYGFILPRAFRLLQSSATNDLLPVSQKTLRPSDRPESASLGVPSLIAASTSGVHHSPGNPLPNFVPSSAFLTPSTVCSATSLCGFISPRSHVQGLPYRGLSLSAEPYRVSPAVSCPRAVERTRL